jgi:hypothetical protein
MGEAALRHTLRHNLAWNEHAARGLHFTNLKSLQTRQDMPNSERHPQDEPPTRLEISAALDRILASEEFRRSRRLADFLAYVVESALEDAATARKGYVIAVEALGRPSTFDPDRDATVRVTATRLRVALARYYSGEGRGDPIVIELPRGSYLPAISRAEPAGLQAMWWRLRALQRLLAAQARRLLPPLPNLQRRPDDGRQDRQSEPTEGAAAARPRRPRRD